MSRTNIAIKEEIYCTQWYMEYTQYPEWIKNDLAKSGIEILAEKSLPIRIVKSDEDLLNMIGFTTFPKHSNKKILAQTEAYAIQYPNGSYRIKLRNELGDKVKYLSPSFDDSQDRPEPLMFYITENEKNICSKKTALFFTEGEKKAISLQQALTNAKIRAAVVSFPGVSMHQAGIDNNKGLFGTFKGRACYIVFDAQDYVRHDDDDGFRTEANQDVQQQTLKLWLDLYRRGAGEINILTWDSTKKGIDDFIVGGGNVSELMDTAKSNPFDVLPFLSNNHGQKKFVEIIVSLKFDKKQYSALFDELDLGRRFPSLDKKGWEKCVGSIYKETIEKAQPEGHQDETPWISDKGKVLPAVASYNFFLKQEGNLIYQNPDFYRYNGKSWEKCEEDDLACEIREMIGKEKSNKATLADIIYCLRLDAKKAVQFNAVITKLCFQNGVYNIETDEIEQHQRENYHTNTFPTNVSKQSPENIDAFLHEEAPNFYNFLQFLLLSEDSKKRLQEWFGYCLVPTPKMELCLFLKGEGCNGKSTLLEALYAILGKDKISCLEPCELSDKFKTVALKNMLVNIASDIDKDAIFDTRFKKLVTGEETTAENKHKDAIKFRPFCKFIFAANDFIPTRDRSRAFYRRFDIIEFTREVKEHEKDLDLKTKIATEANAIMIWALDGLKRLIKNNWRFSSSKQFEDTKAEFEKMTNPVKQFFSEFYINTLDEKDYVNCAEFRQDFKSWCDLNGYAMLNETNLGKELKRLGIERKNIMQYGRRTYCYIRTKKNSNC